MPEAIIAKTEGHDNIDLLPMGWLNERGCIIDWSEGVSITTPQSRKLTLGCWQGLPFLDAYQIKVLFEDLPPADQAGRSGRVADKRVNSALVILGPRAAAARVTCSARGEKVSREERPFSSSGLPSTSSGTEEKRKNRLDRKPLEHLQDKSWERITKLAGKYKSMPNVYGESLDPDAALQHVLGHPEKEYMIWEIFAGSGTLSARSREQMVEHLPPVDYRWGWDVGRFKDQVIMLLILILGGCKLLVSTPSCTPWSSNSRGLEAGQGGARAQVGDQVVAVSHADVPDPVADREVVLG